MVVRLVRGRYKKTFLLILYFFSFNDFKKTKLFKKLNISAIVGKKICKQCFKDSHLFTITAYFKSFFIKKTKIGFNIKIFAWIIKINYANSIDNFFFKTAEAAFVTEILPPFHLSGVFGFRKISKLISSAFSVIDSLDPYRNILASEFIKTF